MRMKLVTVTYIIIIVFVIKYVTFRNVSTLKDYH